MRLVPWIVALAVAFPLAYLVMELTPLKFLGLAPYAVLAFIALTVDDLLDRRTLR